VENTAAISNAEPLMRALATVFTDDEAEIDEAVVVRLAETLRPISSPDVVMEMQGSDDSFVGVYEGLDGIRAGWADWLESFERVRLRFEGFEEHGDNVITYVQQTGITRHGGVEVEQPSAAVWKFRDGALRKVEFHLDREKALASARDPI
jgi:ketosteroid isomerase-like protein